MCLRLKKPASRLSVPAGDPGEMFSFPRLRNLGGSQRCKQAVWVLGREAHHLLGPRARAAQGRPGAGAGAAGGWVGGGSGRLGGGQRAAGGGQRAAGGAQRPPPSSGTVRLAGGRAGGRGDAGTEGRGRPDAGMQFPRARETLHRSGE